MLYFTNDNDSKYILTVIDVCNSLCDGRALRTLEMDEIIGALEDIYDKSNYLSTPEILQADNEFNNKYFKNWCDTNGIKLKITEPYHHRQNAHVERFNQTLQKRLWKIQLDEEIETGKPCTNWLKWYRGVINSINEDKMKFLNKDLTKKHINWTYKIKLNSPDLILNKTRVRVKLDEPEDIRGKKLHGHFRITDTKWGLNEYEVVDSLISPNSVPMYRIKNVKTNKIINHLMPRESLQII